MSTDLTLTEEQEEDRRNDLFFPPAVAAVVDMEGEKIEGPAVPTGAILDEMETTSLSSPSPTSSFFPPFSSSMSLRSEIPSAVRATASMVDPSAAAADPGDELTPILEGLHPPMVGSNKKQKKNRILPLTDHTLFCHNKNYSTCFPLSLPHPLLRYLCNLRLDPCLL